MNPLGRLSVGAVGLEPTRGLLRAKKKKKMSRIGRLLIGVVGLESSRG
jgi:hypothetical protein